MKKLDKSQERLPYPGCTTELGKLIPPKPQCACGRVACPECMGVGSELPLEEKGNKQ